MRFIKRKACEITALDINMCSKDSEALLCAFMMHFKRNLPCALFITLLTPNIVLK